MATTKKSSGKSAGAKKSTKKAFKAGQFIVYPAHGVGKVTGVERETVAGFDIELYVVLFCLLYTSPSPRDRTRSRMPSSA